MQTLEFYPTCFSLQLLLTSGADIHVTDEGGVNALHHAAREGHLDLVNTLLPFGVPINDKDKHGDTALLLAARHGHSNVFKTLVSCS